MKRIAIILTATFALWAAPPQQFKLNLDQLASKASNTVDISLSGPMLKFAAKFLDGQDSDEAKVKKLIAGLQGIYIKHFEFKREGMWTQADIDGVRNQLKSPEWMRIVGIKSEGDNQTDEVYLHMEGDKTTGIAILVAEPRERTVVNIMGSLDLEDLSELGGHFDIPKVIIPKGGKGK